MSCVCGEKGISMCGGCKNKKYCCINCQKNDWNNHKKICKLFTTANYNNEDEILFEYQMYIGTFEPLDHFAKKLNMKQQIDLFTSALRYWNIKSSIKNIDYQILQIINCGKDETLLMIHKQFSELIAITIIETASKF